MGPRDALNRCRFEPSYDGHYESWFQRANHPSRPLAFWLRYTIFSPRGCPSDAVGELWAIVFDGERSIIRVAKQVHPLGVCGFSSSTLNVKIGPSTLDNTSVVGQAEQDCQLIRWSLRYSSPLPPVQLLPSWLYDAPLPRAKSVVGAPMARYTGHLTVDDERIDVDDWVGSQNHNWGRQHTDHYAWGQVAGFDNDPNAFFEVATARLRLGSLQIPSMTPMVLRLEDQEYALTGLRPSIRAHGRFRPFEWTFSSHRLGVRIEGKIMAPARDFVALRYDNPPGGQKICLNTKLAFCQLLLERLGKPPVRLECRQRVAFEILTDEVPAGMDPAA